jgi:zinc D-Ala-D-Ala dipeptidase
VISVACEVMRKVGCLVSIALLLSFQLSYQTRAGDERTPTLPNGFVYLHQLASDIKLDIRYFTAENFIGGQVDGYIAPKCILTEKTADALKAVQTELRPFGLGLKVFDCYRPQRAVDHFIRWGRDLQDTATKSRFYPDVDKTALFNDGYIAAKSSHSRGSTVDLTITTLSGSGTGQDIDMGSSFDMFSPKSWPADMQVDGDQRAHRILLRVIMSRHGFAPYEQEWWHFTLKDEPYPDTYFDFPVQ